MNKKIYLLLLLASFFVTQCSENLKKNAKKQDKKEQQWSAEKKAVIALVAAALIAGTTVGCAYSLGLIDFSTKPDGAKKRGCIRQKRSNQRPNQRPNQRSIQERLYDAILFEQLDEVAALIAEKVSLTLPIMYGERFVAANALFFAIDRCSYKRNTQIAIFHTILAQFDEKEINGDHEETYLNKAIYRPVSPAPIAVVKALLDAKANPKTADKKYLLPTPLHSAVSRFKENGDDGCVTALLQAKADPTRKNQLEQTPLEFAQITLTHEKFEEFKKLFPS